MVYANLWKLRSLWDENHHHRSLIPSSIVPCPYSPSTESIRLAIVWELISIPIRICQQKMMPLRCSLPNLHDLLFASLLKATRHTLHAQHPLQTILWGFDNPPLTTQQSPQCALLGNLCRGIGADSAITDEDDTTTAEETSEPPTTTPNESPLYECLPFSRIRVNCYSTFGITWRNVRPRKTYTSQPVRHTVSKKAST